MKSRRGNKIKENNKRFDQITSAARREKGNGAGITDSRRSKGEPKSIFFASFSF